MLFPIYVSSIDIIFLKWNDKMSSLSLTFPFLSGKVPNHAHIISNGLQPILPATDGICNPMENTDQEKQTRHHGDAHPSMVLSTFTPLPDGMGVPNQLDSSPCIEN